MQLEKTTALAAAAATTVLRATAVAADKPAVDQRRSTRRSTR